MNNDPLLDNRAYEVQFSDSMNEVLTANIVDKNILAQVDEEGHRQIILDEIIDHRQDVNAIGKEDAFTKTPNGMKQGKITKAGWQLCIQLIDESTDWFALKNIKQSYPVQLADYVKRVEIDDKPGC